MTVHRDSDPWLIVALTINHNRFPAIGFDVHAFWVENKAEYEELKEKPWLLSKIAGADVVHWQAYHKYDISTPNLKYYTKEKASGNDRNM